MIPHAVKHSLALLRMGKKLPETCWADWNTNKLLLLHLVGPLHYLYQWCTVKQTSNLDFLDGVSKNSHISNFVKIQPVRTELFHVDIRAGTKKLVVAFRNFVKAPQSRHTVSRDRLEWMKTVECQGPPGAVRLQEEEEENQKTCGCQPLPPDLVSVYEIRLYVLFQACRGHLLRIAWPWCRKPSGSCVANSMITGP